MNLNHSWDSIQYEKTYELQADVADELIKNLEIKPYENVLDVGCGLGNITLSIASLACDGSVLGIDGSPSMIDKAQEKLSRNNTGNISFKVMSATELKFDKEFDVVFSNSVLHWLKKQGMALKSIYHCLKSGGRLGLQFPILNASHPMVNLAEEAIHSLKLEHKYTGWEFPWFVPESTEAYIDLLNQIQFKNVAVKEVETFYTFETVMTVYGFFNSVGLDLFMQPLSKKEGLSLKNEIIRLIGRYNFGNGIKLVFHRLYAQADI